MTRGVRDRILKDVNGNISDHLRNHIHLTNCIHLKNHMHKHSPILADRALMRDLVVLQRSRSLRDPSASPPSWHSPSAIDVLLRQGEREALINGRRSLGVDRPSDGARISVSSPPVNGPTRELRRAKREESSRRSLGDDDRVHGSVSANSESRDRRGDHRQDRHLKTHSELFKNVPSESDDGASSHNQVEQIAQEANVRSQGNNLNRARRRRFRGARRNRTSIATRDAEVHNEMSVASNSFAQGSRAPQKYQEEEGVQGNVNGVPRNGCGIPWNWSRIHDRGKSIIDIAGRSLSCGLSESRSRKGGSFNRGRNIHDNMPVMSEHSSSSTRSDADGDAERPLLFDASGSQGSVNHGSAWIHDYSGELGIFADNLLKQDVDIDSDLASEGRSHERHKLRRHRNVRHQNLTQKYTPRTFRDLVGQNLVVQALSNAIVKKKVGLVYVFYGPHGTGKTTCARIFARALNCLSREHSKPCGFCNSCIAHEKGKSRNVKEIGPIGHVDFESITEVLDNMNSSQVQSQYKVFIFDECDTLSSDSWSALMKVIDRAPRKVVFVLVCSNVDVLPHVIISRCQKFFFPKLKDADIIYTLQWIATKEGLEIDKDALKLIASRSDGSLRDAEMTLEQLSLLGQRISIGLVQELVGLISDEKLVDLLDLALSADTVNTVKNLRDIMESGVEPLALMSQLATVITDILAGSYDFMKGRPKRKFFRRQACLHGLLMVWTAAELFAFCNWKIIVFLFFLIVSKEDMEKLRQALKTLSEAEKQLRVSSDRITWLTAALLQLAPDQQYMLPSSSADTSFNHSPLVLQNAVVRERQRKSNAEMPPTLQAGNSGDVYNNNNNILKNTSMDGKGHVGSELVSQPGKFLRGIEEIWLDVLEKIPFNSIKEFMYKEGKLISLSYGAGTTDTKSVGLFAAPTVQLLFSSELAKSKAEKFRSHILQAFESVLRSPVTIEIRCESRNNGTGQILLPASAGVNRSEIIEIEASPREYKGDKASIQKASTSTTLLDEKKLNERNQSLSLVRSKVSLAQVIQQAEGSSQHNSGWSKRKALSIAEKLEQENMYETRIKIEGIALLEPSKGNPSKGK
ncbi:hypothetical protein RD792_005769 [Penstemon davidsonii]|uniref:AAA+ ATPase domain-containing protein n=1 Tax=Penstemon davidsonii TaxID=160366 RepID=A0ABR0DED1_9LAMI|nr:hypothetical protein RD792_005769 [Penstemon davidsonii]